MSLYRSLTELLQENATLPEWCNVYARVEGPPIYVEDRGGRWEIAVTDLSRSLPAWVAIHADPSRAGLGLPYSSTSECLLRLLNDTLLRGMFTQGELILVQGVPKRGDRGLFLNVPAVLILRPFHLFGRQQIDLVAACSRKSYLYVTKGVRRLSDIEGMTGASIGGYVAEDVFSALASLKPGEMTRTDCVLPEAWLIRSLSVETIGKLILLANASPSELPVALRRASEAYRAITTSDEAREVLHAGPWHRGEKAFANGAAVAPDYLAQQHVLELKYVNPSGTHYSERRMLHQLEAYLAWAMVEHGVENVCKNWIGWVLNLHPNTGNASRRLELKPEPDMLGKRIYNRQHLLLLTSGSWLPAPDMATCDVCELAQSDENGLPAPCTFYCQMERGWDCISATKSCSLLGHCEHCSQYVQYEKLDLFNQLRRTLLAEEEEHGAIREVLAAITSSSSRTAGFILDGLTAACSRSSRTRLLLPDRLKHAEMAAVGEEYEVLHSGRPVSIVKVARCSPTEIQVLPRLGMPVPEEGQSVDLRVLPGGGFPARSQLHYLDWLQRIGEEPISLRVGKRTAAPAKVSTRYSLDEVDWSSRLVLVDAPGRRSVAEAAKRLVKYHAESKRVLVITCGDVSLHEVCSTGISMAASDLADAFMRVDGSASTRALQVASAIEGAQACGVSCMDLVSGSLDTHIRVGRRFGTVIVIEAERLPLLALNRCLKLADERLILVGQVAAAGPRAETAGARSSVLYQNAFRLLAEAGQFCLPDSVNSIEVVYLPVDRACKNITAAYRLRNAINEQVPLMWHEVSSSPSTSNEPDMFTVSVFVAPTSSAAQCRVIDLRLDRRSHLSVRELRLLLKNVTARSIEALSASVQGGCDSSLLGYSATVAWIGSYFSRKEHQVRVCVPSQSFPWIAEYCLQNLDEAAAVLDYAARLPGSFHIVSPFIAQCQLISRLAAERSVQNVRIYPLDHLGSKPFVQDTSLLISAVAGDAAPEFPYPLGESRRLLPLFLGAYREFHLFASEGVAKHHPVFRALLTEGG